MRAVPEDRILDVAIFSGALSLLSIAFFLNKRREKPAMSTVIASGIDPTRKIDAIVPVAHLVNERIVANVTPEYLLGLNKEYTGVQVERIAGFGVSTFPG